MQNTNSFHYSFTSFLVQIMFGQIYQIVKKPKGYTQLIIAEDTPYNRSFIKFNIWNVKRIAGLDVGSSVKFFYNRGAKFPRLDSIEECVIDACFTCFNNYELQDAQRISCGDCHTVEKKERVDTTLLLVSTSIKKYTYSKGISLSFVDAEDRQYIACVFENNPMYTDLEALNENTDYKVTAWVTEELEGGDKFFVDLINIPEMDE